MKKIVIAVLAISISLSILLSNNVFAFDNSEAIEFEKHNNVDITLDGAFIQPYLYNHYSQEDWDKELSILKSVGVNEIIMGDTVTINQNSPWEFYYNSNLPEYEKGYFYYESIENLLSNCKKHGIKVYLGMGFASTWWQRDLSNPVDAKWFEWAIEQNMRVMEDMYSIYKANYPETFAGFYFVYEIWNSPAWRNDTTREKYAASLSGGFNNLIQKAQSLDENMGIYFSPFATREGFSTKENLTQFYTTFFNKTQFRDIDAMIPMDNCGGGGQNIKTLEDWTKAYYDAFVNSNTKLNFYSNNENFVQDESDPLGNNETWGTATIDRYIEQIRITDKYSKKNYSFAYSHYYSPLNGVAGFHETYLEYMKTGVLDSEKPIAPTKVKTNFINNVLTLSWSGLYDNKGISRVNIYKNGEFSDFATVRYDNYNFQYQAIPTRYTDENFNVGEVNVYELEAVDCAGNKSETKTKVVVTAENRNNYVVLDKIYTDFWDENDPMGLIIPLMIGDVDKNKKVNTLDALDILKYIAKLDELDDKQKYCGDIDGNGKVDTTDALSILKTVANIKTGVTK